MDLKLSLPEDLADQIANRVFEKVMPGVMQAVEQLGNKLDQGKLVNEEMNVKQLANFLNVNPKWIYRQTGLKKNPMPHIYNGKYLSFKIKDVLEWRERMNGRC